MRVLFDADSMVYGCGFASQKTLYDWTAVAEDGEVLEGIAKTREDMMAVEAMLPADWTMEPVKILVDPEPVENALALVKRQILRIEARLATDGYIFDRLELFITGSGNFRNDIAKIKPYKGNRLLLEKPYHYRAIRHYLGRRWGAVVEHGWEADDAVAAISASYKHDPDQVMIVSQYKDLRTVPGLLFNYRHNRYELITEAVARMNFYRQIVTGDVVDNIGGIFRAGEKLAETIVESMTEQEMYSTVLALCADSMSKKGCPHADRTPEDVVLELGQLLHLCRHPGDRWRPPA